MLIPDIDSKISLIIYILYIMVCVTWAAQRLKIPILSGTAPTNYCLDLISIPNRCRYAIMAIISLSASISTPVSFKRKAISFA